MQKRDFHPLRACLQTRGRPERFTTNIHSSNRPQPGKVDPRGTNSKSPLGIPSSSFLLISWHSLSELRGSPRFLSETPPPPWFQAPKTPPWKACSGICLPGQTPLSQELSTVSCLRDEITRWLLFHMIRSDAALPLGASATPGWMERWCPQSKHSEVSLREILFYFLATLRIIRDLSSPIWDGTHALGSGSVASTATLPVQGA